jgi:phytoene synthase
MTSALESHYAACADMLRKEDPDRFFACLFAPEAKRPHLHALYCFSLELSRVRELVSEPLTGEIRMQWWRDALCGEGRGDVHAHPIAGALIDTVERFNLPVQALKDLIEGRSFDLYDDPMPTRGDLEGYCGETSSALMRLASLVLAAGRDPGGAEAAGHGGVAYAITGLLRALPWHAARGQLYLPADILDRHGVTRDDVVARTVTSGLCDALAELRALARHHHDCALRAAPKMDASARAALMPLAVVPVYLKRMEKGGYEPFQTLITAPLWRRLYALWSLSRTL